jgi:hypothetical protein
MALIVGKITKLKITELKLARFNPKSRQANIKGLVSSIERVGLLTPITVTQKGEVANGHRRVAAYKKLGYTEIPAYVAEGSLAELFAEINGHDKKLSGVETLEVYLAEPEAIGPRIRARLQQMEEAIGRRTIERMIAGRFTLATWEAAKSICDEADILSDTFSVKALRWIMKYRCARLVRRAIQVGTPPSKLVAAVNNNRPLRVSFVS